jgi:hypothetical protein
MLGSGWRTLDIIQILERDLQTPVIHPVAARVWEIQKRLQYASRGSAMAICWKHCRKRAVRGTRKGNVRNRARGLTIIASLFRRACAILCSGMTVLSTGGGTVC